MRWGSIWQWLFEKGTGVTKHPQQVHHYFQCQHHWDNSGGSWARWHGDNLYHFRKNCHSCCEIPAPNHVRIVTFLRTVQHNREWIHYPSNIVLSESCSRQDCLDQRVVIVSFWSIVRMCSNFSNCCCCCCCVILIVVRGLVWRVRCVLVKNGILLWGTSL